MLKAGDAIIISEQEANRLREFIEHLLALSKKSRMDTLTHCEVHSEGSVDSFSELKRVTRLEE